MRGRRRRHRRRTAGDTRPGRAASGTSSAGSSTRRCRPTTSPRAEENGESVHELPDPARRGAGGRRARAGRPRLAQRQPVGPGRPPALRTGRRARRSRRSPRTPTVRCWRRPRSAPASSSRPSATRGCRSPSSSSPVVWPRTRSLMQIYADVIRLPLSLIGSEPGAGARLGHPRGRRRWRVRRRTRCRHARWAGCDRARTSRTRREPSPTTGCSPSTSSCTTTSDDVKPRCDGSGRSAATPIERRKTAAVPRRTPTAGHADPQEVAA